MAKRSGGKKTMRIVRRVYAPIYHAIEAARDASRHLFRGAEKVVNAGLGTVQGVGASTAKHADETVRNVIRSSRRHRRNVSRKAQRRATATRRRR